MPTSRPPLRLIERGSAAPRPPLMAALEFAAIGLGLTLTFAILGRQPAWSRHLATVQALDALAFGFFALALFQIRRFAALPRVGLIVFGVALASRLALLMAPPSLSDDLYRYVWEGRVLAHGGNPWRQSPLDPQLAQWRDAAIWPHVNHPELSTIYPPLAEAGFALVARLSPTVTAFKGWILLHDLALVLLLMRWMKQEGRSAAWVIAYAWNPLIVIEYAGSGHQDPTAMVWLLLALIIATTRPTWSAIALSIGALVKLAPLVALPFLWRRWTWRARFVCALALATGLSFFWSQTRGAHSGVGAYWDTWRNNELVFHYLERWTGRYDRARTVGLMLLAAALAFAWWRRSPPASATRLAMRVGTVVSPVLHPWYLGWPLLFEPLSPSAPWLLLSFTVILNYGVFATPVEGASFHLPIAWRWLEFGAPALLALVLAARGRARRHEEGA